MRGAGLGGGGRCSVVGRSGERRPPRGCRPPPCRPPAARLAPAWRGLQLVSRRRRHRRGPPAAHVWAGGPLPRLGWRWDGRGELCWRPPGGPGCGSPARVLRLLFCCCRTPALRCSAQRAAGWRRCPGQARPLPSARGERPCEWANRMGIWAQMATRRTSTSAHLVRQVVDHQRAGRRGVLAGGLVAVLEQRRHERRVPVVGDEGGVTRVGAGPRGEGEGCGKRGAPSAVKRGACVVSGLMRAN